MLIVELLTPQISQLAAISKQRISFIPSSPRLEKSIAGYTPRTLEDHLRWFITMGLFSSLKNRVVGPLPNGLSLHGGYKWGVILTTCYITVLILQVELSS